MAEWWNGGMAEWRNGGMAGMAVWQKEWQNSRMTEMATYVLFMVHTDDEDNDNTLIFYSIEDSGNGGNGGNGGTAERMAEWQNGRSGYIRTIYGRHTPMTTPTMMTTTTTTLQSFIV